MGNNNGLTVIALTLTRLQQQHEKARDLVECRQQWSMHHLVADRQR